MNKEESLRILVLLSQIEGYIAGKIGSHSLPDCISEELLDVCEILYKNIKESK